MPSGLETTVVVLCWAYYAFVAAWAAARLLLGDRPSWLFFVNALARYFFLPVPVFFLASLFVGCIPLNVAGAIVFVAWLELWFAPLLGLAIRGRRRKLSGPVLRVATYNLLWLNSSPAAVIAAIKALDADVVALQEVSNEYANAIEAALATEYPHRLLQPDNEAYGNGLISRLPLESVPGVIPDPDWIGDPVIVGLTFDSREVTVVSCHAAPVRTAASARERQARALVDFALRTEQPCIVLGDFNATPFNRSYGILRRGLRDAWRDAGYGPGHTFPGPAWSHARGDGLPRPLRRFVPRWLLRIDFVFLTRHWRPINARTGPDGGSDHRPVVVDLNLQA
jgi:endonuclease/exonuclease/phosphatase (EEP) superfamily protein YafD